uniref:Uncharacterized protein n=1 Tax=Panagrellus redivivus TaxID=6233 RepID=A0A7E4VWG9_PANRE
MGRRSTIDKATSRRSRTRNESEASSSILNDAIKTPETSESLAEKLDAFASNLVKTSDVNCPDLADFDVNAEVKTIEEVKQKRAELKKRMRHFDAEGTTDINYCAAAIAGAKVAVDEGPATRRRTNQLAKEVGVDSSNLLYKPLPLDGLESSAAKQVSDRRKEDIVESFVDFQKQLKFKMNILNHVEAKAEESVPMSRRRASAAAKLVQSGMVTPPKKKLKRRAITTQRTPMKTKQPRVDPLSYTKIMDQYANELASEIKERSMQSHTNMKPIPFSLEGASDEECDHPALF